MHNSEIWYTIYDDGIWLVCTDDDWEIHLGFTPSIDELVEAWEKHLDGVEQ